jgi:hypothetical protein
MITGVYSGGISSSNQRQAKLSVTALVTKLLVYSQIPYMQSNNTVHEYIVKFPVFINTGASCSNLTYRQINDDLG